MESTQTPFAQAARGLQRRRMKNQGISHRVLNIDLAGPHPPACGHSFVVALVGVCYIEHAGENIPCVRGLKRKAAEEVCNAVTVVAPRRPPDPLVLWHGRPWRPHDSPMFTMLLALDAGQPSGWVRESPGGPREAPGRPPGDLR